MEQVKGVLNYAVHNLAVPEVPVEHTRLTTNTQNYSPYGSDNLFPQALILLNRNSSVHRGIINNKTIYTVGDGLTSEDAALLNYMDQVNATEGLTEVFRKLIQDWYIFGNAYLEIVQEGKGAVAMFHRDASKWRYTKDLTGLIWHPDWSKYSSHKKHAVVYPIYPEFAQIPELTGKRSIYHFKQYEPGSEIYGVPPYIAGLNAAGIIYKTDKWNLSRLDNSFKPSGILVVNGVDSPEDAEALQDAFKEAFTGEGNTGKIMSIFKTLGGEGTQFISFNDSQEGDWTQLHTQSEGNIITAHNWFRSLAGIADNTGFDTKRILQEYEVAKNTVIRDTQNFFTDKLQRIIQRHTGIKGEIGVINRAPTSIAGLIDVNAITYVWEGREQLGLEFDPEDPRQQEFIKKQGNGSTAINNS